MTGSVYKSTGSWYSVRTSDGKMVSARIKGIFKIDGITSTNPIAVGDIVDLEWEDQSANTVMIVGIHDRKNYIARQSPSHKKQHHIVAANLDQSMMMATLKEPRTSQGFIDRFLVSSEAFHVPAMIVFNKADIYRNKEMEKYEELKDIYEEIGYRVFLTSFATGEGVDEVIAAMRDKITLISGHSGVGKSSFINILLPDRQLKTQDVSGWSGKGMHTTTFAEMYDLDHHGKIIDTPGMREFGIVDISRQELSHYFPEMRSRLSDCQFNNCLHTNEPGCAIKSAVEAGSISFERYLSYVNILESIDEKNY
jgi:ribosome biogenesis GTPase / thiamine phosphate phosphatase